MQRVQSTSTFGRLRKMVGRPRELNVSALSVEEWNYLRGLFLADGSSWISKWISKDNVNSHRESHCVKFCFSGNDYEKASVCRVLEMLGRIGLKARAVRDPRKNMISVLITSKSLRLFLPDKKVLKSDIAERERFFEENKLLDVELGVPFVAGLLDGDGYCGVSIIRPGRNFFQEVNKWTWSFSQRRYLFLIDYMKKFVSSIAMDSVHTKKVRSNGVVTICVRRLGIEALLDAGIAKYSWRVATWLSKVVEAQSERMSYYDVGHVRRVLGVSCQVVRNWLKSGKISHLRGRSMTRKSTSLSHYYIPVEDVTKFSERFLSEKETFERVKREGMKLVDVAKALGVPRKKLGDWFRSGKLRATLVRESGSRGGWKYLVIPSDEVERLKMRRAFQCQQQ